MVFEHLRTWFLENGGVIADGVVIRDSPLGGNGLFADTALAAGTEILSVPLEACPNSSHTNVANLPVNSLFRLAELLCAELLQPSRWETWLASLPRQCGNWPEWKEAELLLAQKGPPHFFKAAADAARKLPAYYKQLREVIPNSVIASLDDKAPFRRSMAILFSRRFGITCREEKVTVCVPLADMLNHSSLGANLQVQFEESSARMKFVMTRDVEAGDELLFSYGSYDNLDFCTNHGFVVPGNSLDVVNLEGVELRRGLAMPTSKTLLERSLASLPPAAEDESVATSTASSPGCRAIARWRLDYRDLLQEVLSSSHVLNEEKAESI